MRSRKSIAFIDLVRLSLRIFKTKPTRTLLTVLGMAIGIAAVVFLVSLGYGLQYTLLGKLITSSDSLTTLSASYPSESSLQISTSTVATIAALPGVVETSAMTEFSGVLSVGSTTGLVPTIRVMDPLAFRLSGITPDIGTTFTDTEDGMVLSGQALQLMGKKADKATIGSKASVELYLTKPDGTVEDISVPKPFTVTGIVSDTQQPPLVIIPTHSMPIPIPSYKVVYVRAKDATTMTTLRDTLTKQGFIISANVDLVTQAERITNIVTGVLAVFGITALVVSAIGMFNTMIISFIERTYEVGVMKAIGATDSDVRNLFLMEAAVIGFLGGAGGLSIGLGLGTATNAVLNLIARQMGGQSFELFILPLWFGTFVFVTSVIIGVVSGLVPALRASRLSPREALSKK